jgi:hypothetical protein
MATIDRPKNVTDNARRAYAEWHNCPTILAARIFWPYGRVEILGRISFALSPTRS